MHIAVLGAGSWGTTAQTRTVAEGVGTAYTVHALAERHGIEMPVCNEVYRVLTGEIHAPEAYRGLTPYYQAGHEREPG
jgi:glycerol-3-phosphate dehydrogenase (NAD(P)+)